MMRKILALFVVSLTACQPDPPASSTAAAIADSGRAAPSTAASAATNAAGTTSHDEAARTADGRAAVLFLGTSLTAGYGVGAEAAFPARVQQRIDSAGLPYRVVNAGLSGETSAGGLERLDWSLQDPVAVLVLELGANDGLRGLPVAELRDNLDAILRRTHERYPDAHLVIAGMQAPPNLGPQYTRAFRDVYPELARRHDATLIPFLLDGVAAEPALNQEDGIHPNEEGHALIAAHVWAVLAPVLEEAVQQQR